VNPLERDELIRWLAVHIDADEPPGLAATKLARTVLDVFENRGGPEAVLLEGELVALAERYPRNLAVLIPRYCTTCASADGSMSEAKFVAAAADGTEWYECGNHPPTDNALEVLRVKLTPLDVWCAENGLAELRQGTPR
jgi:hypothetical protein